MSRRDRLWKYCKYLCTLTSSPQSDLFSSLYFTYICIRVFVTLLTWHHSSCTITMTQKVCHGLNMCHFWWNFSRPTHFLSALSSHFKLPILFHRIHLVLVVWCLCSSCKVTTKSPLRRRLTLCQTCWSFFCATSPALCFRKIFMRNVWNLRVKCRIRTTVKMRLSWSACF